MRGSRSDFHIDCSRMKHSFELHSHDYCELVFVISGSGLYYAGNREYEMRAGDLFVAKGRELHGHKEIHNLVGYSIMFRVADLDLDDCRELPGFWVLFVHEQNAQSCSHLKLTGEAFVKTEGLCRAMLDEYHKKEGGFHDICRALLTYFVIDLSRKIEGYQGFESELDFRLAKAMIFLETNYETRIRLSDLAGLTGLSERHFSRLFQKVYGVPPMQHLKDIRISCAKRLLSSGRYTITEIAGMCGFEDGNYFSRSFKEATGYPPSQWPRDGKD